MKKLFALFLTFLIVIFAFAGCGSRDSNDNNTAGESTELVVFAAASMTESLEQIAKQYKEIAPDVELVFNFDSSGTLKTQIEEGADCDIFISAAQKQMNQLDAAKDKEGGNEDGLDFVKSDTRTDILENKVVLVLSGSNTEIASFDDLAAALKNGKATLVMGNEDVPVGQYTQKILKYYGLDEADLAARGLLTYGSNVKEVTTQVSEAAADAGIIYATDAFSAKLVPVDVAEEKMCGKVIYPAAVMKNSKNPDAAKAFLEYLKSEEAGKVFESVGFTTL